MRVVFILTTLAMVGTAVAGPVEDALAANAAFRRGDFATALQAWKPEVLKTNQAPAACSGPPPLTLAAHVWQDRVPMKFLYLASTLLAASVAGCGTLSVLATPETATSLNGFRVSHGLSQLRTDGTLAALASEHAADMARRDSLDLVLVFGVEGFPLDVPDLCKDVRCHRDAPQQSVARLPAGQST